MNPPNPTSITKLCMVGFTRKRTRRRSQCRKMRREAAEEQQYIPLLPQDIIMEILSRLPIHSLFQCTLVSKAWRDIIIRNPIFSSMQHNRALENQNDNLSLMLHLNNPRGTHLYLVERGGVGRCKFTMIDAQLTGLKRPFCTGLNGRFDIRGSCNGLLFITFPDINESAYVLNPITRECLMLPIKVSYGTRIAGFGFHPARNEYKVLRVVNDSPWRDNSMSAKADILTLGTNAWRQIKDFPLSCMKCLDMPSPYLSTVLVNGCLHWCRDGHIIALDMGDEKFGVVTTPDSFNESPLSKVFYHLMVWKGYLTVVQRSYWDPSRASTHIWVMKEYNVKESWTKQVNVKCPTWFCGTGLYWPFDDESFIDDIEFIDHPRFKAHSLLKRNSRFRVMQHVGSLLSLKTVAGKERVQDIRFLPELLVDECQTKRKRR